jgi:hypothetical protein
MRTILASVAVFAFLSCNTFAAAPISVVLDGSWAWSGNVNPGGSSVTFSLSTSGNAVTGTGNICGIGPSCTPGPVTITGNAAGANLDLTFHGTGFNATLSGHVDGNTLTGTWSGYSGPTTFNRH